MKTSVLIIAHNESEHIVKCIESLLSQTKRPDEIVLINHNSTDATGDLARKYPITVIDFDGPKGSVHARIRGFEAVSGDYVLCVDGDSVAAKNWVRVMTDLLSKDGTVMVGSWVRMKGTLYNLLSACYWYFACNAKGLKATDNLWGASLGLRTSEKDAIIKALKEGLALSEKLNLSYNPDDYWLALFMSARGNLEVSNKTCVMAHAKETSSLQMFRRGIVARGIRKTILSFLSREGFPKL